MKYKTKGFKIRYCETDQMGFVHHSNYLKYFEMARIEWLNSLGISYQKLEKDGILLPVVNACVKYIYPAFFGDTLRIKLHVKSPPTVKISFNYLVYNQEKKEIAKGETTIAFLNTDTKKPMRCPVNIRKKISII